MELQLNPRNLWSFLRVSLGIESLETLDQAILPNSHYLRAHEVSEEGDGGHIQFAFLSFKSLLETL